MFRKTCRIMSIAEWDSNKKRKIFYICCTRDWRNMSVLFIILTQVTLNKDRMLIRNDQVQNFPSNENRSQKHIFSNISYKRVDCKFKRILKMYYQCSWTISVNQWSKWIILPHDPDYDQINFRIMTRNINLRWKLM